MKTAELRADPVAVNRVGLPPSTSFSLRISSGTVRCFLLLGLFDPNISLIVLEREEGRGKREGRERVPIHSHKMKTTKD